MELGGGSSGSSSATALSLAAFLFSAVLYTRDIRRRRRRRRRPPCDDEFDDSLRERDVLAMDGALEALRESGAGDSVSSRGLRAAIRPPASYWNGFMLCLQASNISASERSKATAVANEKCSHDFMTYSGTHICWMHTSVSFILAALTELLSLLTDEDFPCLMFLD